MYVKNRWTLGALVVVILCLTGVEVTALANGINGTALTAYVGAMGLVGGSIAGRWSRGRRD